MYIQKFTILSYFLLEKRLTEKTMQCNSLIKHRLT